MKFNYLKKSVTVFSLFLFTSTSFAQEPLKVGYVYAEEIGDYGWTYHHEIARKKVDELLGDKISSSYVITTKENAKSAIDAMVKDKYEMIFVTSVGLKKAALNAARANPSVKFAACNSDFVLDNLEGYTARYDEGYYLAGIASATVSKSKILGAVAPEHIPFYYRNLNAFALGAQSVDPSIKVKVIWTNSRVNPEVQAQAVRDLKSQGSDVILQQTLTPAVLTTSEEEGLWVVGFNAAAKKYAPTRYLTSVINDWSLYYEREIEAELGGRWGAISTWSGFSQKMVKMTPINSIVPQETRDKIRVIKSNISVGKFDPFTGPIVYADGDVFLEDGKVADYNDMLEMKGLVKGIEVISN